jgi:predicted nuclease with TOPRIM domain
MPSKNADSWQTNIHLLTRTITDQEAAITTSTQSSKTKQSVIHRLEKERSQLEEKTAGLEVDILSLKSTRDKMEERLRAAHEV